MELKPNVISMGVDPTLLWSGLAEEYVPLAFVDDVVVFDIQMNGSFRHSNLSALCAIDCTDSCHQNNDDW